MRQRLLLGASNRKRYTEDYKLLDMDGDILEQVRMQSTMYNRTMQSGYSELMGLIPPASTKRNSLTAEQVRELEPGHRASPPFKVRDFHQVQKSLGLDALPYGFQGIPIYN